MTSEFRECYSVRWGWGIICKRNIKMKDEYIQALASRRLFSGK